MGADPRPVYLLAGGRPSRSRKGPDPLAGEALMLAGISHPSVAYIGAASGDNAGFRAMLTRLLQKAGAGEVKLAPLCGGADPRGAMRVIESSHLVFISGGDVEAGMNVLVETGMVDFLRAQYRDGKPFFGVSAGSIMLAKSWVRWKDPDDHSSAEAFPCLAIARVCCDTHDEEGGWEELRALARLIPARTVAYGIPSGTALIAAPDGSVRALGGEVQCFRRTGAVVRKIQSIRDSGFRVRD